MESPCLILICTSVLSPNILYLDHYEDLTHDLSCSIILLQIYVRWSNGEPLNCVGLGVNGVDMPLASVLGSLADVFGAGYPGWFLCRAGEGSEAEALAWYPSIQRSWAFTLKHTCIYCHCLECQFCG